jgi:ankyrin repeat protein
VCSQHENSAAFDEQINSYCKQLESDLRRNEEKGNKYRKPQESELRRNAEKGNLYRISHLLQKGPDVNAKNEHGDTSLMLASSGGHLDVVRHLVRHDRVNVNAKNNLGNTALHACEL